MSLVSGPVSFQRFLITGDMPTAVDDKFVNQVGERVFGHMPPLPDDSQIGWIGPQHLFETTIDADAITCGSFVQLGVRIDKLKVPPSVVKAYVQLEQAAALEASGRAFLNRSEQRQAREAALARADDEARAGHFRRMGAQPLLIDLEHQVAYLGSLSMGVADKVMQLFFDTFGCGLEPIDAERVAVRVAERAGQARALESLTPFSLVPPPDGDEDGTIDFAGAELGFLGKEFLTWLWYQIDSDANPLKVSNNDEITVMIDKTMRLKCDFGLTGTDVITADSPASLPEARAALRTGKQPNKLGLIVGSPLGEFRFTLDGERLAVSSLVVPEDDAEEDPRVRLEQRFELITDAGNLLDALFELYVLRRMARDWDRELRAMSAWARGKDAKLPRTASA